MGKFHRGVARRASRRLAAPLGFAFVAIVLGYAAFQSGMYFDRDLYGFEKGLYFCAGVLALVGLAWRRKGVGFGVGGAILPLALAATYAATLAFEPASRQGSADEALRWLAFACWAAMLGTIWRSERARQWGAAAIQSAGLLLLVAGWLGWMGWYSHPDLVLLQGDPELSATGRRLAGYLQYPNAYGAILAAFLLMQWQAWTSAEGKRWQAWLAGLTAIPYGGALLLTESRGACLALLGGLAVAVAVAKPGSRKRWAAAAGLTLGGSALMAMAAWHGMPATVSAGDCISGWGACAAFACAALGGAALIGMRRALLRADRPERASGRRVAAGLTLAASLVGLAGAIGLWRSEDVSRLGGHYETAASRWMFYKDAWRMFADRPWFGFGGDSWRALMHVYQSEPYVGNEVHSGYLAMLLDVGIVGLGLLLLLLLTGIRRMWRSDRAALAPASVLLVHAAIDFDWSYAFAWLLLLAWMELHGGSGREARLAARLATFRVPGAWRRLGRAGAAALLVAGAALGTWAASRSADAAQAYGEAAVAASPEARAAQLRASLAANPAYEAAGVRLSLASLLPLRERASELAAGLRDEPQSAPLRLQLGIVYAELGDVAQALASLREGLRLDRFSREGQTAALAAAANMAERLRDDGDAEGARRAAAAGAAFFASYRELVRQVAAADRPANDRRFALTVAAQFHAARCDLILGRRDEAEALLRAVMREGDGDWEEQARRLLDA